MKKSTFFLVITFIFNSCATTNKMIDEAFHDALIGQNEMTIYARVGKPTSIAPGPDGGKIIIYEFSSKGMYSTPYKSSVTYNTKKDITGNRQGWTYTSNVNTVTNDPKYTVYPTNVSYLNIYLDKQGNCFQFEQNLPQEQLDIYHERFKHFRNKD